MARILVLTGSLEAGRVGGGHGAAGGQATHVSGPLPRPEPDRYCDGDVRRRSVDVTTIGHWIDGALRPGASGRTAPVYDPARGVPRAEVALATAEETDAAVEAAAAAA